LYFQYENKVIINSYESTFENRYESTCTFESTFGTTKNSVLYESTLGTFEGTFVLSYEIKYFRSTVHVLYEGT